ncbi:MAG: hypothetical protein K0R61_4488 [Microvirga sp.]|nr:hypothetical protein [Microvirga sp.]
MAGMAVNIHEARYDHHPAGIDLLVGCAGIAAPDMDDVRAPDHEIGVAEIDMGLGRFVPGDDPVAVSEVGRFCDGVGHTKLHKDRERSIRRV